MVSLHKFGKIVVLDTLGVILVVAGILFGWLPGPGGIPLLIAGLSLLSIHHEWAKKLLKFVKTHGLGVLNKIFIKHPLVWVIYDLASATFMVIGIYLLNTYTRDLTLTLALFSLLTGITLFFGNRERLQRLIKRLKR